LAIDLEANSLYAYWERVCLIQITVEGQDYIVDPLTVPNLDGLGEILQDPAIEKVFHAAEYDLIMLKRQYGWKLDNLFDTMWAARILGYSRCGLANILQSKFQAKTNKRHQKANWCRRPLSAAQLTYAQMDTHYLLQLRNDLAAELAAMDCVTEAQEIFAEQCRVKVNNNGFDPDGFWSINGVTRMARRQQAIVKALYLYRDKQARRQNRPPFKVFDDRTLIELARAEPKNLDQLPPIYGMSQGQIRRYGGQIVRLVREAQEEPAPKRPPRKNKRPPEAVAHRYEKLVNWRKEKASARGVESDVIISRDALWSLASTNPRKKQDLAAIDGLGPWRQATYGDEILAVLGNGS
jgi:ribonuclease D